MRIITPRFTDLLNRELEPLRSLDLQTPNEYDTGTSTDSERICVRYLKTPYSIAEVWENGKLNMPVYSISLRCALLKSTICSISIWTIRFLYYIMIFTVVNIDESDKLSFYQKKEIL